MAALSGTSGAQIGTVTGQAGQGVSMSVSNCGASAVRVTFRVQRASGRAAPCRLVLAP